MSINTLQMQPGLSISAFMASYGTEEQCEAALRKAKWPQGFLCPACNHTACREFRRGKLMYFECKACGHQASLTADTMMQKTHLPLTKWFLAIYLVTQSKTNIAALALRRQLGISWKSAWMLKHKLMEAMLQREENQPLGPDVRVDDAYLGGERTGGKAGRGSENKVPFVIALEVNEDRPLRVRFDPVKGFSYEALKPWAAKALKPGSCVTSDGLIGFEVVKQLGFSQKVVIAPKGKAGTEVPAFRWLNVVLGNLKTALTGTHHAFKFAKYAARYLAEVQYRFNRRYDMPALVPRLLRALVAAKPCPYARKMSGTEQTT